MYTTAGYSHRQLERELEESVTAFDRYIDIGVTLHVVARDPNGTALIPGNRQRVRVVRAHHLGGMLDTRATPPRLIGPSQAPLTWFCSEDQEPVILHRVDEPHGVGRLGLLVYGSEGSGKSTAIAMWLYCRWLEVIGQGREGGAVAPTKRRLKMVRDEMFKLFPSSWYAFKRAAELVVLADGTRIQWVSTKKQSTAGGSPLQGFNWSFAAEDELQDIDDEMHDDIGQRLRAAAGGRGKRIGSCTAKQTSAFRNRRDAMMRSGEWERHTMLIARSPFIDPTFITRRATELDPREFDRRFNAIDLPPQHATYGSWARGEPGTNKPSNLWRIPDDGSWMDVTTVELMRFGPMFELLGGHDPGTLFDVTLLLKAYAPNGRAYHPAVHRPRWVIVDEVTTENTTTEQHIAKLLPRLHEKWRAQLRDRNNQVSGARVLVNADPYGNTDSKTDIGTYNVFKNHGFVIRPAAYSTTGDPTRPGRVPLDESIAVVNTLLCNAAQERRLFVAIGDDGLPVAKRLVQTLEEDERDPHSGKADTRPKNRSDISHWSAALRYAVWPIERPRLGAMS